ncbi:WG repeat-containing protein [Moraxella oblonga]|uniref:WG repeat-containing protein n=1 Tax=Moraxella oblonga TaxID=200413 RepID=UPI0014702C0B|nr:WG repeat-containing protein [Moraxella oblonga]
MMTRHTLFSKSLLAILILTNISYANVTPPNTPQKTQSQLETQRQDEQRAKMRAERQALQRAKTHHGLTPIQGPTTQKYGYKDIQGNTVISPIYDQIEKFTGDPMIVVKSGLYGVIDKNGKTIIDTVYDDIQRQDSYYIVKKQGLYGVLDENGEVVIDVINDELHDLSLIKASWNKSAYFVKKQGKYGIYDDKGSIILPFEYDKHGKLEGGILPLSKNGKWGMIKFATDQYQGVDFKQPYQVMVDFTLDYDFVYGFTDELSLVYKNDKYGFIDKTGKQIIPLIYDIALPFYPPITKVHNSKHPNIINDPVAFVGRKSGEKMHYGAIDKTGKIIIPIEYDKVDTTVIFTPFIIASKDNQFSIFGRNGSRILSDTYDKIQPSPFCFGILDLINPDNKPRQCTLYTIKDGIENEIDIKY